MTRGQTHTNDLIAAKEAEIGQLRRNLEIAEAELRGMIAIRDAGMTVVRVTSKSGESAPLRIEKPHFDQSLGGYRGGRQPGAISKPWRRILSELYWKNPLFNDTGEPFCINEVINAAAREGIRLRPSEAEARLQHYSQFKFVAVSASDLGKYVVTDDAADKFGFRQGPLKDEAPDAEAQEPQESLGKGGSDRR